MYSSCRGVLNGAKSTTACITSLGIAREIILADVEICWFQPKPPNRQIFQLYSIQYVAHLKYAHMHYDA